MISSFRLWLVVIALLASAVAAACGDDGDNGDDGDDSDRPTATMVLEDENGGEDGDVDGGDGAAGDVPVPPAADEKRSGSFSSSDIPFFVPGDEIDPDAFTSLEFTEYELDASPEEVIEFYRDEMDGWEEVFVFSGGTDGEEGGFGVWTRDDGRTAVWVGASRADGTTELLLIVGTQE